MAGTIKKYSNFIGHFRVRQQPLLGINQGHRVRQGGKKYEIHRTLQGLSIAPAQIMDEESETGSCGTKFNYFCKGCMIALQCLLVFFQT